MSTDEIYNLLRCQLVLTSTPIFHLTQCELKASEDFEWISLRGNRIHANCALHSAQEMIVKCHSVSTLKKKTEITLSAEWSDTFLNASEFFSSVKHSSPEISEFFIPINHCSVYFKSNRITAIRLEFSIPSLPCVRFTSLFSHVEQKSISKH